MKLSVNIRLVDGVREVVLQAQAATQESQQLKTLVAESLSDFEQYRKPDSYAHEVMPNGEEVFSLTLRGPFALSRSQFWIHELQHDVVKLVVAGAPKPVLEYAFNDQVYPNWRTMLAAMKDTDTVYDLGAFQLDGTTLRVTDPGYSRRLWPRGCFAAVPGTWQASVILGPLEFVGIRPKVLRIRHDSVPATVFDDETGFVEAPVLKASVDTGQCGFFDDEKYPFDENEFRFESDLDNTFMARAYYLTEDRQKPGAGVIVEGYGVLSQSGHGDGSYSVFLRKNEAGQAVAAYVRFIRPNGEDASSYA